MRATVLPEQVRQPTSSKTAPDQRVASASTSAAAAFESPYGVPLPA
jgi:hypothetical protein